jgi:tetratricopeptide (TPR) repeat protein
MDEALEQMKSAVELDPLSSRIADNYGSTLLSAGKFQEALAMLDRSLQLQPENLQAAYFKAWALAMTGRADEAGAIARTWPTTELPSRVGQAMILGRIGRRDEARAIVSLPEVLPLFDNQGWFTLEEPKEALARLKPASARSIFVSGLLFDPIFDPIRKEPRFIRYLEVLGLTEAHARAQAWREAHPPEKVEMKK